MFTFLTLLPLLNSAVASVHHALHISDIHLDTLSDPAKYGPDSFCRSAHNLPALEYVQRTESFLKEDFDKDIGIDYEKIISQTTQQANYNKPFGWYLCDSTPAMLTEAIKPLSTSTADLMIITGDFAAHNQLSEQSTRFMYKEAHSIVQKANTKQIPVIATVGNEDFYPDYNATKCYSEQLYHIWEAWQYDWIPASGYDTFKNFGGYRRKFFGDTLRVISINTVMYHQRNYHFRKTGDPCGQFQWLDYELGDALNKGEAVWIIGHIPPTFSFWWPIHQSNFFKLVKKYQSVIKNTFWGHTHHDSFFLGDNIWGLIQASITPNPPNPSIRTYEFDTLKFEVYDYLQQYVDLKQANRLGYVAYQNEYQYSTAYGANVSRASLHQLNSVMFTDNALWNDWSARSSVQYFDDRYEALCGKHTVLSEYWECRMLYTM